jgi:hypothetical protein
MKQILFILFALLLAGGCKDSDDSSSLEPSQRILGKWKEIARGNDRYPELTPNGTIIEFLPDGTYHGPFGFHSGMVDDDPIYYRMESDSLYLEKEEQSMHIYRYTFTGSNQFFAEHIHGMVPYSMDTPSFHTFKRIK